MEALRGPGPGSSDPRLGRVLALVGARGGVGVGGGLELPVTELPDLAAVPAAHDGMAERRATGKYVVRIGG